MTILYNPHTGRFWSVSVLPEGTAQQNLMTWGRLGAETHQARSRRFWSFGAAAHDRTTRINNKLSLQYDKVTDESLRDRINTQIAQYRMWKTLTQ